MNSFYSEEELKNLGLKKYGNGVLISRNSTIYSAKDISIGDNTRIDDFCILSGKITLGNNIHIAAGTYLFAGQYGIIMEDYSCLSSRCAVYALTDDYSGNYMANAVIPEEYKNVTGAQVILKKHSLVGTGCTILPGVVLNEGAAVGAMSFINKSLEEFSINIGTPCRKIKNRSRKILEVEKQFSLKKK